MRKESNMLNKRRKQKLPDYAVRFLGYSARIVARKENAAKKALLRFDRACARGHRWTILSLTTSDGSDRRWKSEYIRRNTEK
jgi:hypothetical protein